MKLLKRFIVAFSLALSLGFVSTAVALAPPAPTIDGLNLVLGHVAEAIKAVDAGESKEAVREHIMAALRVSKEIHATEEIDKKRLKANRILKKARTAIKKDDPQKAKDFLIEVENRFKGMKKLL